MTTQPSEHTAEGTLDRFKGRVREAIGALLDDESLRLEGRSEQWAGHAKAAAADAIDQVRELVDSALVDRKSSDEESPRRSEEV